MRLCAGQGNGKIKNQSKFSLRQVLRSFTGADFSQIKARPAGNTLCILKGLNVDLGKICPVKPVGIRLPLAQGEEGLRMNILSYVLIVLLAYLIGCSSMALYLSKYKGVDLRASGSKNLGASNAMVTMGWRFGLIVGIHDIGKAVLAVVLAKYLGQGLPLIGAAAGVACVLGHMFPFYLRFRGGKGFASYLGMTLALNWKFALIVMLIVVLVTLISDYIVVGTVTTVLIVPAYMGYTQGLLLSAILCIATVAILFKHRENYLRIYRGTEIGLRRANRGDDRKI